MCAAQSRFLKEQACDVWLLTEVDQSLTLDEYDLHLTSGEMAQGRRWAGVLSKAPLSPMAAPRPASAMALISGILFCSSILPWRSCPAGEVWSGANHGAKISHAFETLMATLPRHGLVWGGDWNHALSGREYAGSAEGRKHLLKAVRKLGLTVRPASLPHQIPGLISIDHIAVLLNAKVVSASRVGAAAGGDRRSDHALYFVELIPQGLGYG